MTQMIIIYVRFARVHGFIGVWPHIVAHILLLAVLVAWPQIILWLPMTMMK